MSNCVEHLRRYKEFTREVVADNELLREGLEKGNEEHARLSDACERYIDIMDPEWSGYMPDWFTRKINEFNDEA